MHADSYGNAHGDQAGYHARPVGYNETSSEVDDIVGAARAFYDAAVKNYKATRMKGKLDSGKHVITKLRRDMLFHAF